MGLEIDKGGRVKVNTRTLETNIKGVFAGGDLVTGPNTVIDAIAAGKKAAQSIDRFLRDWKLTETPKPKLPSVYIEPTVINESETVTKTRAVPSTLPPSARIKNFLEVEMVLPENLARSECRRCLRCDLAFTNHSADQAMIEAIEGVHHD